MNSKDISEKLARQLADMKIRQKKIDQLRNRIVNGQYRINNEKVARSLFVGEPHGHAAH